MSNGEFCCAIGLCCPPESATRRSALIRELAHGTGEAEAVAEKFADWLIDNVDMLPKGIMDLRAAVNLVRKQGTE